MSRKSTQSKSGLVSQNQFFFVKLTVSLILLLILLIGSAVSLVLVQKNQDIRQQAIRVDLQCCYSLQPEPSGSCLATPVNSICLDVQPPEDMFCQLDLNTQTCNLGPFPGLTPLPETTAAPQPTTTPQPEITLIPCYQATADFDRDCDVDYDDYEYLVQNFSWNSAGYFEFDENILRADLNNDQKVDIWDYNILVDQWTGLLDENPVE